MKPQIASLILFWVLQLRGQPPAFDVASIKMVNAKSAASISVNPSGLECTCTIRMLIAAAYSVNGRSISSSDALLDGSLYHVAAKSEHQVSKEQVNLMLQSLLAERVKLSVRHESKVEPVYNLVVAPSGSKLKDSAAEGAGGCALGANRTAKCANTTMASFSAYLSSRMGRMVVDQTGLKGTYDFALQLEGIPSIDELRAAMSGGDPAAAKRSMGAAMNDWTTSSIFTDMPKQLGLKLDAGKAAVESLVVEHLEKPTEN